MEWKPVKHFEEYYEVNEIGEIRSFLRTHETSNRFGKMERKCGGKILKAHISSRGYATAEFNINKKIKKVSVHRIVYETFVSDIINNNIIHHMDYNKSNNHYKNLVQMDYVEHNNIHSHPAWNKGIKNPKEMVENARKSRESNYLKVCKKTYELKESGKSFNEIAKESNTCVEQSRSRYKRYKEFYKL